MQLLVIEPGVGAAFLIASSILLFLTKATVVGWVLDLIVFVLAAIIVVQLPDGKSSEPMPIVEPIE